MALCSYGLCGYGLCSYGLCSYGLYIVMAYVVMARLAPIRKTRGMARRRAASPRVPDVGGGAGHLGARRRRTPTSIPELP